MILFIKSWFWSKSLISLFIKISLLQEMEMAVYIIVTLQITIILVSLVFKQQ